jgi:hypothetical protein
MQAQNNFPRKRGRPKKTDVQPTSREQLKLFFLEQLAVWGEKTTACEKSGVPLSTLYNWISTGFITKDEIATAISVHEDRIYQAAHKWATQGIPHVVQDGHGHTVFEADGVTPKVEYRQSEKLLAEFLKHHPRFKPTAEQNGNGLNGHMVEGTIEQVVALSHQIVHVRLISYIQEGRDIIMAAMREAEKYRTADE